MNKSIVQKDWWSKSMAGGLLGLLFAFACSGIYSKLVTGLPMSIKAQLAMWMVAPIWLTLYGLVYLFRTGKQAWIILGSLNLLAWVMVLFLYQSA